MRIISKLHDFYDSGMGYGQTDNAYIFNRVTETIKPDKKDCETLASFLFQDDDIISRKINSLSIRRNGYGYSYSSDFAEHGFIVFCGTVYPYIRFSDTSIKSSGFTGASVCKNAFESGGEKINSNANKVTFYDKESALRFIKKLGNTSLFKSGMTSNDSMEDWIEYTELVFEKANEPFFLESAKEFCVKYKTPYFVVSNFEHSYLNGANVSVEATPVLKHFQFQKNIDANTAFQEISMFYCGVIGNIEKDVVNISDKDMRDAKGFDNMSFKKEAGGKKRRKNK
ncbi:hypothetical protein LMH73_006225 [Vibrio splendidus]|nr:hypothetical protein [Vibrio splendidus]MCC4880749.1 hypothetical protein [Vibrio splendidus]